MLKTILIGCICILLLSETGQTQVLSDTLFVRNAYNNTVALYENTLGENNGLYNGARYILEDYSDSEHPFFRINDWQEGDVTYNGQYYNPVNFFYDLVKDCLITEVNGQPLVLVTDKISTFSIGDLHFINLTNKTKRNLTEGLYEVGYEGRSQILIKHTKDYQEKIEDKEIIVFFTSKDHFYVLRDGTYFPFRKKNDFLKIFSDKKSELRSYINTNHIVVSKKDPRGFAMLAAYYDTLNGK